MINGFESNLMWTAAITFFTGGSPEIPVRGI